MTRQSATDGTLHARWSLGQRTTGTYPVMTCQKDNKVTTGDFLGLWHRYASAKCHKSYSDLILSYAVLATKSTKTELRRSLVLKVLSSSLLCSYIYRTYWSDWNTIKCIQRWLCYNMTLTSRGGQHCSGTTLGQLVVAGLADQDIGCRLLLPWAPIPTCPWLRFWLSHRPPGEAWMDRPGHY